MQREITDLAPNLPAQPISLDVLCE